jgi:hypothetical protein
MISSRWVLVMLVTGSIVLAADRASAQSRFSQRDRLFLLYSQYSNHKAQRQLGQQQQDLSRQFQQFSQQPYGGPMGNGFRDPVEGYVEGVERGVPGGMGGYAGRPGSAGYGRGTPYGYRRAANFQSQQRYFNPVR